MAVRNRCTPRNLAARPGVMSGGWPWWAAAAGSEHGIGVTSIKVRNERAQRQGVLDDALANDKQRASALGGCTGQAKAIGRIQDAKFGPSMPTCASVVVNPRSSFHAQ